MSIAGLPSNFVQESSLPKTKRYARRPEIETLSDDSERKWKQSLNNIGIKDSDIVITVFNRTDSVYVDDCPDKVYSSLVYKIEHSTRGLAKKCPEGIIAKIEVIDFETLEEITKNKQSVLKGSIQTVLRSNNISSSALTSSITVKGITRRLASTTPADELMGVMKIQLTSVQYHHDQKRAWRFRISYFSASDPTKPILIKVSPPFLTFARKPTTNDISNAKLKRKKDEGVDEENSISSGSLDSSINSDGESVNTSDNTKQTEETDVKKVRLTTENTLSPFESIQQSLSDVASKISMLNEQQKQTIFDQVMKSIFPQLIFNSAIDNSLLSPTGNNNNNFNMNNNNNNNNGNNNNSTSSLVDYSNNDSSLLNVPILNNSEFQSEEDIEQK